MIDRIINFITFRHVIKRIKAAFALTISTIKELTSAAERNSNTIAALTAEQKQLRVKFDELVEHSRYQKRVTQAQLQRAGHKVE